MKTIYRIYHHIGNQWKKTFESTDKSAFDEQVMLDHENGANIDTEIVTTNPSSYAHLYLCWFMYDTRLKRFPNDLKQQKFWEKKFNKVAKEVNGDFEKEEMK